MTPNPSQLRAMARPTQPEPCKPGRRCERYASGLGGCGAGECRREEALRVVSAAGPLGDPDVIASDVDASPEAQETKHG